MIHTATFFKTNERRSTLSDIISVTPRRKNFSGLIFGNKKIILSVYNDNNLNLKKNLYFILLQRLQCVDVGCELKWAEKHEKYQLVTSDLPYT